MSQHAIVVQCFNKLDTLQALCESLMACSGRHQFDLIFWADSAVGSREPEKYLPAAESVHKYIVEFETRYRHEFSSVALHINEVNHGCYKTCQMALDYAFERHDFVIFTEDDTIFSKDALCWFLVCSKHNEFTSDAVWAVGGESIFFDSRQKIITPSIYEDAVAFALQENLLDKFISVKFIPSTCFATSSTKWQEFRASRGETNGDVALCQRCEIEQKLCLLPVVARVRDVGMLHEFGYSVSVHTISGVQEVKNTYLSSDDLLKTKNMPSEYHIFTGEVGPIFSWYTKLDKFSDVIDETSQNSICE